METSLEDSKPSNTYQLDHQDLKVTIPLTRCLQKLKEKHNTIAKIHHERFEQVKSNVYQPPNEGLSNLF
jgi:Ase1/PRC1/MAP65 family protein